MLNSHGSTPLSYSVLYSGPGLSLFNISARMYLYKVVTYSKSLAVDGTVGHAQRCSTACFLD